MATSSISETHPRRGFTSITQLGLKALDLALANKALIEPRLPKGMLPSLQSDLDGLGDAYVTKTNARGKVRQATVTQDEAAARACVRVKAIRTAVKDAKAPKAVQYAYGVGTPLREAPSSVKAAITQILDRLKDHADEMEAFGILADDVDALKADLAEVTSTDMDQEKKRAKAPLATRDRNVVANRVVNAALRIGAVGMLAFAGQQVEYEKFADLEASAKRTRKRRGQAEEAPEENAPAPEAKPEPKNG
jgi:hypothetical protein